MDTLVEVWGSYRRGESTVLGVLDGGVFDVDGFNGVVGTASYGSDGQAMATGAGTASEDDVLQSSIPSH